MAPTATTNWAEAQAAGIRYAGPSYTGHAGTSLFGLKQGPTADAVGRHNAMVRNQNTLPLGGFPDANGQGGNPLSRDLDGNGIPDIVDQRRDQIAGILDPNNVLNDPAFSRSEAALMALMDQGGPLSEEVQNLIAGRMSDSTAAAADSQRQLLREQMARTGGSLNDPSAQAQVRAIEANRMGQNATGRRDVAIQAALENFGAQQGLADQLRGLGATRQGLANPLRGQWSNLIAQYTDEDPNNQQATQVAYRSPGIPQSAYNPQAVNQRGAPSVPQQAAPAPAPAPAPPAPSGPPMAGASQGGAPIVQPGGMTLSMPTQAFTGSQPISQRQEAPASGGMSNMEALNQASQLRKSASFRNRNR